MNRPFQIPSGVGKSSKFLANSAGCKYDWPSITLISAWVGDIQAQQYNNGSKDDYKSPER